MSSAKNSMETYESDVEACAEQVEHDLAWVRLLIGLHATRARSEVNEIVSGVVEMGTGLQFTEDKLTTMMEAAQVSQAAPLQLAGHIAGLSIAGLPGDLIGSRRSWVWWAVCESVSSFCGRLSSCRAVLSART